MKNTKWLRTRHDRRCPVCNKPDWCMVAEDKSAAICARIESSQSAGQKGAGWLHRLQGDDWERPKWRAVKKCNTTRPSVNMQRLSEDSIRKIRPESLAWLANELGLSLEALILLGVGWNQERNSFSFPMREPNGYCCGIRYRSFGGSKFSEPGSREGMFFNFRSLVRDALVIVEGASDTAATIDLGFHSVVGRANCRGNVLQVATLCRRLRPDRIIIVPDNDQPGIEGANQLQTQLETSGGVVRLLILPDGIKDVRQCCQETKNAEWLAGRLGELTGTSSNRKHGGRANDSSTI